MWANAQLDSRPVEYRWRPLFNAAVWLTPTTRVPCSNAAKTRKPVEICRGASNYQTDFSRWWAEVHHIVGTCGGDIVA